MNPTELVRELLEVLEGHEWNIRHDETFCNSCERLLPDHGPACRYVAAVQAAREFLATPPVVENRTPLDAAAEAIRKAKPGIDVHDGAGTSFELPFAIVTAPNTRVKLVYDPRINEIVETIPLPAESKENH